MNCNLKQVRFSTYSQYWLSGVDDVFIEPKENEMIIFIKNKVWLWCKK